MSLLAILLWLLAAVVILVTAAFVLPLGVRVEATVDGPVSWKIGFQPFGRFGPRFRLPKPKAKATESTDGEEPSKRSRKPLKHPMRLAKGIPRLLTDLLAIIRIREVSIDTKFGCADPADTGEIYGLITPFLYGGGGLSRLHLRAEPVFDDTVFEGRAMVDLAFVPIALVPPAIRFGWALYGSSR